MKDPVIFWLAILSYDEVSAFLLWAKARNYSLLTGTVEPLLSGTVISGHPLLNGQFSKSRNLLPLMFCNFELY